MITASHNPKEDNGYKVRRLRGLNPGLPPRPFLTAWVGCDPPLCRPLQVYWSNGAQISSPHDREILCCVEEQLEPWSSSCWEEGLVETSPLRTDPLTQMNRCYMEELTSLCFHRFGDGAVHDRPHSSDVALLSLRDLNIRCPLKVVHSSFHGVGHNYVQEAFRTFGLTPPIPVPEQKDPDPNFSSVSCPNPEEGQSVLVGRPPWDKQHPTTAFDFLLLSSRNFLSVWRRRKMLRWFWPQILTPTAWL